MVLDDEFLVGIHMLRCPELMQTWHDDRVKQLGYFDCIVAAICIAAPSCVHAACICRWNRYNPFRFVWDPRLAFSGYTVLGYSPDTGW